MTGAWSWLVVAIASEVVATSALKASDGMTRLAPATLVVVGYATSFWFLGYALRTIPLGAAYAVWAGVGIAAVTVIGILVYGHRPDGWAMLGIALIVTGVLVIRLLSQAGG